MKMEKSLLPIKGDRPIEPIVEGCGGITSEGWNIEGNGGIDIETGG